VTTSQPGAGEQSREAARQLERQHPGWIVLWGIYTRQYVAFPLFRVPPETVITAYYPPALAERMQAVEDRAQRRQQPRRSGGPD
jgi:hypothetical protein